MTNLYLAGKVSKNDWRHEIIGLDLRDAYIGGDNAEINLKEPWPILKTKYGFHYVGPFFVGDDHGCGHAGKHGVGLEAKQREGTLGSPTCFEFTCNEGRRRVVELCTHAIDRTDVFFAWMDDQTAYGTVAEIGYARAKRKKIVIATPPGTSKLGDIWFALTMADIVINAETPYRAFMNTCQLWTGD